MLPTTCVYLTYCSQKGQETPISRPGPGSLRSDRKTEAEGKGGDTWEQGRDKTGPVVAAVRATWGPTEKGEFNGGGDLGLGVWPASHWAWERHLPAGSTPASIMGPGHGKQTHLRGLRPPPHAQGPVRPSECPGLLKGLQPHCQPQQHTVVLCLSSPSLSWDPSFKLPGRHQRWVRGGALR